jgi:hypothetical protein
METESAVARNLTANECVLKGIVFDSRGFRYRSTKLNILA